MSTAAPSIETQPTRFAAALFPGFQLLDVAGPLDVLNILAQTHPHSLYILSSSLEPVHAGQNSTFRETVVPTHTFDSAPEDIEVLLVPGGYGARDRASIQPLVDYVTRVYPKLRYLLTVCTGSAIVGMGGLLDGKKATTNKISWDWATSQAPKVDWVPVARWVKDGNIWTSSGVSAGIDLTYDWVASVYGEDLAEEIANRQEYIRNRDPEHDPFAATWKAGQNRGN